MVTYKQMIDKLNKDMDHYDALSAKYEKLSEKYERAWDAACSARNYLVTLCEIINPHSSKESADK